MVKNNRVKQLRVLLKLRRGIPQMDLNNALLESVKVGRKDCLRLLLASGAQRTTRDESQNTPLILACQKGNVAVMQTLLTGNADEVSTTLSMRGEGGATALHFAAKGGYAECTRTLLSHSSNVDPRDDQQHTPLTLACMHAPRPNDVIPILLRAGCDVNAKSSDQKTALHYAASRNLNLAHLIEANADPNARDVERCTPLHIAAKYGRTEHIYALIRAGSALDAGNNKHRTAFHLAVKCGSVSCLEALVNAGASPYVIDYKNRMPVHYAFLGCHYVVAAFFIRFNYHSLLYDQFLVNILQRRKYNIAKALVIGGSSKRPLWDWIITAPEEDNTVEKDADHIEWLKNRVHQPDTLKHTCRLVIRQAMGHVTARAVETLPLPKKLLQYVSMVELLNSD